MFDTMHVRADLATPVNELAAQDLDVVFDDELSASIAELHRTIERLSAERTRRIAEADRREIHRDLGHPSTASWLADRCRLSWRNLRCLVATANTLPRMPLTSSAYANGNIDTARARGLVAAHDALPEIHAREEELLLDVARTLTPRELRRGAR